MTVEIAMGRMFDRVNTVSLGSLLDVPHHDEPRQRGEIVASCWLDEAPYVLQLCWSPHGQELAYVRQGGFSFYRFPELSLAATFELEYAADIAYASTGRSVALCDWECGLLLDREAIQPLSSGR
jgi:hypothetical protein